MGNDDETLERKLADFSEEMEARLTSISKRLRGVEEAAYSGPLLDLDDPAGLVSKLFIAGILIGTAYALVVFLRSLHRERSCNDA